MTIRVLICDDHLIVRHGIKQVLADAGDIIVMGEAANGPEAVACVRSAHSEGNLPDVVLLDIALPQRDGLDVLRALKADFPKLPILMLSTYPDRQYSVRCLKLGAAGYLNKSADAELMIDAIRKVSLGRLFITPSVAEQLASAVGAGSDIAPLNERLSHREHQVFRKQTAMSSGFLLFVVRAYVSTIRKRTHAHYCSRCSDRPHAADL